MRFVQSLTRRTKAALLLAVALCGGLPAGAALAAGAPQDSLNIKVSESTLLTLDHGASSVFVADPQIADVQVPMPTRVFVFGKKAGHTTIYAIAADGTPVRQFSVTVSRDLDAVRNTVSALPGSEAKFSDLPRGVAVTGTDPDPKAANLSANAAEQVLDEKEKLIDSASVRSSVQVNLRVRIAEVSRTLNKELGFNWAAIGKPGSFNVGLLTGRAIIDNTTGLNIYPPDGAGSLIGGVKTGSLNINAMVDAMAEEGLISILAEPSLTAISGQAASFLAGGEFPIPVAASFGTESIEFKQYGVGLDFVPTVLSSNRISLHVRPEVSELSTAGSIVLNSISIPGITVRRADTTVELGSGESFAIAGLLQSDSTTDIKRYPGLGDLPILGALFRSSTFQRNESELVIIVTPYIVSPVDNPSKLKLPTDGIAPATDLERIFSAKIAHPASPGNPGLSGTAPPRLIGDAGFDLE